MVTLSGTFVVRRTRCSHVVSKTRYSHVVSKTRYSHEACESCDQTNGLAARQKFQDDAFAGTKLQYGVDRLAVAVEFG
jgi:hypothetical protein